MLRLLVVYYAIGFVSCQVRLNWTISAAEINGTTVRVSELVTNSDTAVSEADLATVSTLSAGVLGLNPISTEDSILDDSHCPRGSSKPCIVKCCPLGESLGISKLCEPSTLKFQVHFFSEKGSFNSTVAAVADDDDDDYDYVIGNPCLYERYRLEPRYDSSDEFHVLRNGSLRAPYLFPYLLEPNEYCLEVFEDPDTEEGEVLPLVCFPQSPNNHPPSRLAYIMYPIGLLISVPFLIVTMMVYCLIPELRDLHGKSLVCYVLCLTVAFIFLAAVQLGGETFNQQLCVVVAFIIQFSFLACFSWLNALCFNTWWTVVANVKLERHSEESSQNHYRGYMISKNNEVNMPKETERKFFIYYSLYAWCCPLVILVVSMTFDLMPIIPSSFLKPNFGENKCWFSSQEAELPYFYGPVAVSICFNIVLFVFTAYRICCHHRRAHRPRPRQIFRMCVCLFCVMGMNWAMEVVSWFARGPDYIWYVTDVINTLQGLVIFGIFVFEPQIRSCVWKKWGPKLAQIMCCSSSPHSKVFYCSPEDADRITSNM